MGVCTSELNWALVRSYSFFTVNPDAPFSTWIIMLPASYPLVMNTRPSPIEIGDGTPAILVANGMLHRICPSAAARPTTLFVVMYRYCFTPPIVAGMSELCDITSLAGLGDR